MATKPTGKGIDVIVFDGSNAAHRISAATQPLTNSKGERVEVIFGLLRLFSAVMRHKSPSECYIVWDGKKSRMLRQKLYPAYKAHRETDRSEQDKERINLMHQQVEKFWALFGTNLPVNWMISDTYEADDIISMLAHECTKTKRTCVIVSGDKDMLQLVNEYVSVYSPNTDKTCTLTNFEEYSKGYPSPITHLYGKCLQGDDSDNIKGVPKVGEKTALKVLKEHEWNLSNLLTNPSEALKRSAVGQSILSPTGRDAIRVNYRIMSLHGPVHQQLHPTKIDHEQGKLNTTLLKAHFAKQQFASLLASFQQFINPFLRLEL